MNPKPEPPPASTSGSNRKTHTVIVYIAVAVTAILVLITGLGLFMTGIWGADEPTQTPVIQTVIQNRPVYITVIITATSRPPETDAPISKLTWTPETQGTPTLQPTSQPGEAVCNCASNVYNCSDFSTHAQAQACYDYCLSLGKGDIHWLDGEDKDGKACETLP